MKEVCQLIFEFPLFIFEKWIKGKFVFGFTALFCFFLVFVFSFPPLESICNRNPNSQDTWDIVLKQMSDPFTEHWQGDPSHHNAKRTFRLFIPFLFGWLPFKNILLIYLFQLVTTLFFFYLFMKIVDKQIQNQPLAFLLTLGLSFIYGGKMGIINTTAQFDIFSLSFLLLALGSRQRLFVFLFLFLAALNDERGIIAMPMVLLYHFLRDMLPFESQIHHILKKALPLLVLGALVVVTYLGFRYALSHYYHLKTSGADVGFSVLLRTANMYLFALWSALEGYWILFILVTGLLILRKQYFYLSIFILAILPSFFVSFLVLDSTRSLSYLILCIPSLSLIISAYEQDEVLKKNIFLSVLWICILVPTYFAIGAFHIEGNNPIFIKLIKWIL